MNKTILVFAPHPDDETLGCGGTIAKKINEGLNVVIVLMTDGRHAFSETLGATSAGPKPGELKEIRKQEFLRATGTLGVPKENLIFLDFEDGTLDRNEEDVETKIVEILRQYTPVEVYFPFVRDYHPDHKTANRIVKRCVQKLGLPCTKYQYSIVHEYARIGPLLERIVNLVTRNIVEFDISDFLYVKENAIEEFKSEISVITIAQTKPLQEDIDCFLKRRETFYVCH